MDILKKEAPNRFGSITVQVVLCAVFLVPLAAGIYLSTGTNRRTVHANQVAHDLASMYSQGVDFSQPSNQNIARQLLAQDAKSLIILTRIRGVAATDCAQMPASQCTNSGNAVIVQRIVIGNPELRPSSLGTPLSIDRETGNVLNWATDTSARVTDSNLTLKPGETAYAAEAYIEGPDEHTGVYARTLL